MYGLSIFFKFAPGWRDGLIEDSMTDGHNVRYNLRLVFGVHYLYVPSINKQKFKDCIKFGDVKSIGSEDYSDFDA